ncbi:MAG: two-component system sensor histidine kinase TorS [Parasphingorhabdus sp.]|jgi:two-component system sensor histidine kinase TorS
MLSRLSISAKLLLAFGGTFTLAIIIAVTAWYGFENIAISQQSVIGNAIPTMREAQQLAEINAGIVASAGRLAKSTSEADRALVNEFLDGQSYRLLMLVDTLQQSGFDAESIRLLQNIVQEIRDNLIFQNELVGKRIRLQDEAGKLSSRLIRAADELTELSESLVANAASGATATSAGLYDLIETSDSSDSAFNALDRLVEVDLDGLERMFELRLRSARLGSYLAQANREVRLSQIQELERRLRLDLRILRRRLADVVDPGRKSQATHLLNQIDEATYHSNPESLFNLRVQALESNSAIDDLVALNNTLASNLTISTSKLVNDASRMIDRSTDRAERSLKSSRSTFLAIAVITALAVLILFWWFLQRRVIRRLKELEQTTRNIASGDLSSSLQLDGNDELASMASALNVFRDNALAREQLEVEIKDYQQHLEQLVSERTTELEQTNTRLADSVSQHELAREKAERANRAKTTFLATMSHELRTPVSGMLGTTQLLEQGGSSDDQSEYIHALRTAGGSLLNIVNDILDLAKFESGEVRLEYRPFDLATMALDLIALMKSPATDKGLELSFAIDPDIDSYLEGDGERIRQVLTNLLNNAIKFTDKGQIELIIELLNDNADNSCDIRFTVSDTGVGIPKALLDNIFEPFTQVDASIARKQGGTGLGLAISRRLVQAMGGKISVDSTPNKHTEFQVDLQLKKTTTPFSEYHTPVIHQRPQRPLKLLVVEDDPVNAMVTRRYLENTGHSVEPASSGFEAINKLKNSSKLPDVVLMDIGLPGLDGVETTRRIRADQNKQLCKLPIIAMSAHIFREEIDEYLNAGMNGYLGKPFNPDILLDTLARVMDDEPQTVSLTEKTVTVRLLDRSSLERDHDILGTSAIQEIVDLYLQSSKKCLQDYTLAFSITDHKQAAAAAHRVKSAAGSIGLDQLHNLSARLEQSHNQTELIENSDQLLLELIEKSTNALLVHWTSISALPTIEDASGTN